MRGTLANFEIVADFLGLFSATTIYIGLLRPKDGILYINNEVMVCYRFANIRSISVLANSFGYFRYSFLSTYIHFLLMGTSEDHIYR